MLIAALQYFAGAELSLMLLVSPVLFLLRQLKKTTAVKKVYRDALTHFKHTSVHIGEDSLSFINVMYGSLSLKPLLQALVSNGKS